jgi:ribosome-binding factor A
VEKVAAFSSPRAGGAEREACHRTRRSQVYTSMAFRQQFLCFGLSPASAISDLRARNIGTRLASATASPRRAVLMGRRFKGPPGNARARPARRGDGIRPNRVGEMIRREIAPIVDDAFAGMPELQANEPLLVSVVDVRCSDDLRNARVSVSIFGSDNQRVTALSWLKTNRRALRFELAQCMRGMKTVPELSFAESEVAQAVKTVGILNMLSREREEKMAGLQNPSSGFMNGGDQGEELDMDPMADNPFIEQGAEEEAFYDETIARTPDEETLYDEDDDFEDEFIIDIDGDDEDDFDEMGDDEVVSRLFKTTGPGAKET